MRVAACEGDPLWLVAEFSMPRERQGSAVDKKRSISAADSAGTRVKRIPTAALNRVLRDAQNAHPPPVVKRHRPRILYATQGATDPPTFTLFASRQLPPQYLRYLERRLRESFDLGPTPIKLRVRARTD